MASNRIKADTAMHDIVMVMGDGNIGAMTVVMNIVHNGRKIDPDDTSGGIGSILTMDKLGIYGSRIWCLYRNVCNEDLAKTIAVLRAYELGQLAGVTKEALINCTGTKLRVIDVDEAVIAVKKRLPRFNKELAAQ